MSMDPKFTNPRIIAEAGEKIYAEKYRADFEARHMGQFVAIDVSTGQAFLGPTAEAALSGARQASPGGIFHLIRVGQAGAFRVSYSVDAKLDWLAR